MGSIYAFLGSTILGIVTWAFRVEGKLNLQSQKHDDLKDHLRELLDAKFDAVAIRLERIERSLNGHRD